MVTKQTPGAKQPTVADNRREQLRRLVREHGNSPSDLAAALGYTNGSFIVQMAGPNPSRPVTEKTARSIEEKLNLPPGIMDQPVEEHRTEVVAVSRAALRSSGAGVPTVGADSPLVADVVRMVANVAEAERVSLPPTKLADLVALAWTDTLQHDNKPREEFVRQLVKLVK